MENFLWGLLATLIGSLSFVAYKHPTGYQKVFRFLIPSVLSIPFFLLLRAWTTLHVAASILAEEVMENPTASIGDKSHLITGIDSALDQVYLILIITLAVLVFLVVLRYLPEILDMETDTKNSES